MGETKLRVLAPHAIDEMLLKAVERGEIPGVVAAVTNSRGTTYAGAFGYQDLDARVPMTSGTIFNIASMTKAVTAVAVMQLVERGVLNLDAPAGSLLPALGRVQVFDGFDRANKPILRAPTTPVTLRHLLTHTSGYSYDLWNDEHARYVAAMRAQGTIERFDAPLMFDPGTRWQYSTGYDWAGRLVEAVTAQRLEAFVRENIFLPLAMNASWTVPAAHHAKVARLHHRGPGTSFTVDPKEPPEHLEFENGGGGIHTTAEDYLKFIRMILNRGVGNGHRVLEEPTLAELTRADAAPNNDVTPLITTNRTKSNPGEFFPGVPKRHSLGFVVNQAEAPTGRSANSLAWAGLFNTYYWIDPTREIGGVFMTQILPFLDDRALPLFLDFETAVYRAARD